MYVHGEDEREGKLTLRDVLEWERGAEPQEWLEGDVFARRVGLSQGKGGEAERAHGGRDAAHGGCLLPASRLRVNQEAGAHGEHGVPRRHREAPPSSLVTDPRETDHSTGLSDIFF